MGTASDPLVPGQEQGQGQGQEPAMGTASNLDQDQGQEPAMGTASDPLAPVSGLDLALDQEPALQLEAPHSD